MIPLWRFEAAGGIKGVPCTNGETHRNTQTGTAWPSIDQWTHTVDVYNLICDRKTKEFSFLLGLQYVVRPVILLV